MDVKRILYGAGVSGALASAFLAGSVALRPVFAQTATPGPTRQSQSQQQDQREANEPAGAPEAAEANEAAETNEAAEVNGAGEANSPAEQAEQAALQAQAAVTADQANQTALGQVPGGTVQATHLGDENGTVVYEVSLVDSAGKSQEVKVDAKSGAIVADQGDGQFEHQDANEGPDGSEAD